MRDFLRWLVRFVINLIARVDVRGYENVPQAGNFVIASNHIGILDAALLFYALDGWNVFIPVAEKWELNPFLKWLGKYFNFVFIDRFNPDIKALRKIITLMEQGNNMVIAPEGTRSRVGSMIEGRPGVSYLASKLGRPIIPVALAGTEDKVIFGNLKRLRRPCPGKTVTRRSSNSRTRSCAASRPCCLKNIAACMQIILVCGSCWYGNQYDGREAVVLFF
jgi:1-acyl-sn-glycerol-3-phosphate acyltransferase